MSSHEPVFVDTSGWIALLDSDDLFHEQAAARLEECGINHRPVVTTDWVLAETGNGLARLPARRHFARATAVFLGSPNSRLVRVDAELFGEALDLYDRAADKSWGLIDCASLWLCGASISRLHYRPIIIFAKPVLSACLHRRKAERVPCVGGAVCRSCGRCRGEYRTTQLRLLRLVFRTQHCNPGQGAGW